MNNIAAYACSFLAPKDLSQYAPVDKAASKAVRRSLENYHFRQISSFPPDSFLGQISAKRTSRNF